MDAFFDAPSSGHGCASLVDLQQQLRQLLDSKVTPAKAEHVSVNFELRSNVTFAVPVTDAENASLEAGAGVDPRLLRGARAAGTVVGDDGQLVRHINSLDTVLSQSQDDPVVQRIVSKHIMAGIGETDQSQWIMRSMARGTQAWTFTYGCKDSAQTWARQNAKNPAKTVVGEWSNKDGQDPANLNRPAFDCRGTLTIAFSKSEKAISVKYEHTNMHKTVGELLDLLAPPPPRPLPIPIEGRKSSSKKTPKKRQAAEGADNGTETPGEDGVTPRPKKRKKSGQEGERSTQKKRSRKKKDDAGSPMGPTLAVLPPEMPGARPVGDTAGRPLYNTQAPQDDAANGSAYPDGLIGSEPFTGSEVQASAMASSSLHAHSILNLPAGEAERRRETAIRLLAESNVDPKTLTPEQFSIFANQAPALQKESLAMLVEYGAERLTIVLPEKAQDASESPAAPAQDQLAGQVTVDDAQQSATAAGSAQRKRRGRAKNAETGVAGVSDGTAALTQTDAGNRQKKPKGPKLSRGSCTPCRACKLKCDKEKPSCSRCLDSATACSYPLERSRKSKAFEEEAEDSVVVAGTEQPADTLEAVANEEDEPDDLPSPGFRYEDPGAPPRQDSEDQPEVEADPESGPMQDNPQSTYEEPNNGIYHHSSGLTSPDSISPEVTQQMWASGAGADYNQTSVHGSTNNGLNLAQHIREPSNTLSFPDQRHAGNVPSSHAAPHQHQKAWGSYTTSQSSGAVDIPTTTSSASANTGQTTTSWPAYSTSEATGTKRASASPRQARRPAKSTIAPSDNSASVPDGMHQASALAQAAMNSAAARTRSPVQTQYEPAAAVSRAKSRQGAKPQTRTPVPSQGSNQPQPSAPAAAGKNSYSTVSDKASVPNYNKSSYAQYSSSADQSNNSVAYQPYSQQNNSSAPSSSYPNYDSYSGRTHTNSAARNAASSYTSSAPSTADQWGNASSERTSLSYTPNPSTAASSSLNMRPSNPKRSQIPPSFNVRPKPPTHAAPPRTASTAAYGQTEHGVPQNSYNSYPSQPQPQQTSSNHQQQGWYTGASTSGYGTGAARSTGNTNPGYSSAGPGGGGSGGSHGGTQYGQQQQQQQQQAPAHHAMNLSSHAYNSMGSGEQPIYHMLPGGSGH